MKFRFDPKYTLISYFVLIAPIAIVLASFSASLLWKALH